MKSFGFRFGFTQIFCTLTSSKVLRHGNKIKKMFFYLYFS